MRFGAISAGYVIGAAVLASTGCGRDELMPLRGMEGVGAAANGIGGAAPTTAGHGGGAGAAGAPEGGATGVAGSAATGPDADGDGLSDAVEARLRTDPNNADSDGDGLDDGVEVDGGTLATVADTDGDGLNDGQEDALGTDPIRWDSDGDGLSDGVEVDGGIDPTRTDSDGDGWSDAEEVALVTDPSNPFSWDFGSGRWPDFSEAAAESGVDASICVVGGMMPDFEVFDQLGSPVSLYQFYGYVVLLVLSAGWCSHCQTEAAGIEALWERHREQGLMIIYLMVDDYDHSRVAGLSFRQSWAQTYGIEFPVTGEGEIASVSSCLSLGGLYTGSIPFMILLDDQLQIDHTYRGAGRDYETRITELLG